MIDRVFDIRHFVFILSELVFAVGTCLLITLIVGVHSVWYYYLMLIGCMLILLPAEFIRYTYGPQWLFHKVATYIYRFGSKSTYLEAEIKNLQNALESLRQTNEKVLGILAMQASWLQDKIPEYDRYSSPLSDFRILNKEDIYSSKSSYGFWFSYPGSKYSKIYLTSQKFVDYIVSDEFYELVQETIKSSELLRNLDMTESLYEALKREAEKSEKE